LLGCDTPCATVDAPDGIIASVRSADPELYRVSPCRAGHHQWLGSGSGAWLPLKEAVMTLLNNEGVTQHTPIHYGNLTAMVVLSCEQEGFKFKEN
jgi:hypothetical protein